MMEQGDDPRPTVDTEIDAPPPKGEEPKPDATDQELEPGEQGITVKIDGKDVVLTEAQIADAYKNGLRQSDYTKKTMEAAELRRSSQAELERAQSERAAYAQNLERITMQLEGALGQQQQMDWNALAKSDPAAWVEQRNLYEQRQAAYQQAMQQRQAVASQIQAEQANQYQTFLQAQQQELLAKLPGWKDGAKAKAEREALKTYLKGEGFDDQSISGISDHRAVVMARKAMLYDQMVSKASAASKRVATLPAKVERPGVAEAPGNDKRSTAYQRLARSGRVEDAAAIFASML